MTGPDPQDGPEGTREPPEPRVWKGFRLNRFQREAIAAIRAGSATGSRR